MLQQTCGIWPYIWSFHLIWIIVLIVIFAPQLLLHNIWSTCTTYAFPACSYEKALELQEAKIKEAFAVAFEAGRQQGAAATIAAPSQSGGIKSATLKDGSSTLTSLSELAPPPSSSSAINITTASERFDDGDEDTWVASMVDGLSEEVVWCMYDNIEYF